MDKRLGFSGAVESPPASERRDDGAARLDDYLLKQLELAHRRNDLVDQLRFKVFQIFFAFHGLIIGAIVLGGPKAVEVREQLAEIWFFVPGLVLVVGYCLFALFLR